jgi:hypothetical protein
MPRCLARLRVGIRISMFCNEQCWAIHTQLDFGLIEMCQTYLPVNRCGSSILDGINRAKTAS